MCGLWYWHLRQKPYFKSNSNPSITVYFLKSIPIVITLKILTIIQMHIHLPQQQQETITPIHLPHFSVIHPCLWVTNWNTNPEVAHSSDSPAVAVQASSPNWANTQISPCKQTCTRGDPTHTDPKEWNSAWAPSVTSRGKISWKSTEDTAGHTQKQLLQVSAELLN